jgi:hypothetical protein
MRQVYASDGSVTFTDNLGTGRNVTSSRTIRCGVADIPSPGYAVITNEADSLPAARARSALGGLPSRDYSRNPWLDCTERPGTNAMGADEEELTEKPTSQAIRQFIIASGLSVTRTESTCAELVYHAIVGDGLPIMVADSSGGEDRRSADRNAADRTSGSAL